MRTDLVKALSMSAAAAALIAGVILAPAGGAGLPCRRAPAWKKPSKGCGGCHGIGQILTEKRSAEEWANTVTMMITNGAPVSKKDDFDKVVGYLATYFGTSPPPAAGAAPRLRPLPLRLLAAPVEAAAGCSALRPRLVPPRQRRLLPRPRLRRSKDYRSSGDENARGSRRGRFSIRGVRCYRGSAKVTTCIVGGRRRWRRRPRPQ